MPDPAVVAQVVGYMRTLVCIVEANPPPKTDLEIDNPQLRFVKDGQTVIPDERYLLLKVNCYHWYDLLVV